MMQIKIPILNVFIYRVIILWLSFISIAIAIPMKNKIPSTSFFWIQSSTDILYNGFYGLPTVYDSMKSNTSTIVYANFKVLPTSLSIN